MGCIVLGWLIVRGAGAYFEYGAVGTGEKDGVKWGVERLPLVRCELAGCNGFY